MLQVVFSFQNSVKVTYVRYVRRFFNFKCVLQRGGRSIFRWTGNKKFQYGISRFWEKYGPETVFSTLDSAGNYQKKQPEIGGGNQKKWYFDTHLSGIWNTLKTVKISKCYIK